MHRSSAIRRDHVPPMVDKVTERIELTLPPRTSLRTHLGAPLALQDLQPQPREQSCPEKQ